MAAVAEGATEVGLGREAVARDESMQASWLMLLYTRVMAVG